MSEGRLFFSASLVCHPAAKTVGQNHIMNKQVVVCEKNISQEEQLLLYVDYR
jgi:hypothetical protein